MSLMPCIPLRLFLRLQGTGGIQHSENEHTHIAKHRQRHSRNAHRGQDENPHLDPDREHHVLTRNPKRFLAYFDANGYLGWMVVHEHHIGRLDGGIAAQRARA